MKPTASMLAGVGAGAGLVYFLDPDYGPRRRALVRDKVAHTAALTRRAIGTTSRDALHRTYGTAVSFEHLARREQVDDDVLLERVRAKLGRIPVAFDAELTRLIPNQEIAWRTLPGSTVGHAGIVRFDREPNGQTRVHIRMSYNPPAGWLRHGIAAAFGVDPKSSMDEDLARMKTLIETGNPPHDAAERRAGVR